MKDKIKILIVDDHSILRDGLEALLNGVENFEVVDKTGKGYEAIELYSKLKPDIVLMDIRIPDLDGISSMEKILEKDPNAKVIILTTYMGEEDIYRSFEKGAKAYLLKDTPISDLEKTILKVFQGEKVISNEQAMIISKRIGLKELTQKEIEILKLISEGYSNKQISSILKISENTVKTHLNNIFEKLDASSRTEAISKAIKKGILHP